MSWGFRQLKWSVVTVALVLCVVACGGGDSTDTTNGDDTTSLSAGFSVYAGTFHLNGEEIGEFDSPNLQAGDEVASGEGAHGMIRLGNEYTIEMYKDARLRVVELRPPELVIFLEGGHITINDSAQTTARLKIDTSSSDLETVDGGAAFTVCQPPTLNTCLAVERGVVELTSAGATRAYHEGEDTSTVAVFVEDGMPPAPDRCVPTQAYEEWFEQARVNDADETLGQLVANAPECDETPGDPDSPVAILVKGDVDWTDTQLEVAPGETLLIDATGEVKHGTSSDFYGPDGNPNPDIRRNNLAGLEGENHSALVGKIGEDGAPFLVGAHLEIPVESEGLLYLGINDIDLTNNTGEYAAAVTVNSGS